MGFNPEFLTDPKLFFSVFVSIIALTAMEIVLGIDNIVFITILSGRLPEEQQPSARRWGLALAMVTRIALLFCLSFLISMDKPFFHISSLNWIPDWGREWLTEQHHADGVSAKDLVLLAGGLFLLYKSVHEIHERLDEHHEDESRPKKKVSFMGVITQIAILDIVFSLDSVITAVGMVKHLWIMVVAIIIAVTVMLIFSEVVARFIERRPTLRMLALSFLILIAVVLISEALGTPINKGYVYFAMAFSLAIEFLNLSVRPPAPEPQKLEVRKTEDLV